MLVGSKPWGVKGLTDSPRAPIIAKAKIGERTEEGGPRRLDYITFKEPQTGRPLPEYQALFGEKPIEFPALLSADCLEDMADVAWKRWGANSLKCRGDGEIGIVYEKAVTDDDGVVHYEQRECAGEYNRDHPELHKCEFARPSIRGGKQRPPECKPVMSVRLVVPQIPGLGVVQIDTGGVASSIPTLMAQLRMIEDRTRDEAGHPHMAEIAVKVSIRPFKDRMGGTAYCWQIEPLRSEEAAVLRANIEGLVRIEGQLINVQALPPLEETPEPDIYGLPAGEDVEDVIEEVVSANSPPKELADEITEQERLYWSLVERLAVPKAKADSFMVVLADNRTKAAAGGDWDGYYRWLHNQTGQLALRMDEQQGTLA